MDVSLLPFGEMNYGPQADKRSSPALSKTSCPDSIELEKS